jgi:hypothetical protein
MSLYPVAETLPGFFIHLEDKMDDKTEPIATSSELELYLERKSICMVEGIPREQAIETAFEQVKGSLKPNQMPDKIAKDLHSIRKK